MLGLLAEFESNLRRERKTEGIAAAKARGVYKGGKARVDPEEVRKLAGEEVRPAHIVQRFGIFRGTIYRFLPAATAASSSSTDED